MTHPTQSTWNLDRQAPRMLNKVAHLSGSELLGLMSEQQELVDRQTPESSWKRQPEQQLISHAVPAEGKLTPHMHAKPESLWKYILSVLAAFLSSKAKIYILYSFLLPLCLEASRDDLCAVRVVSMCLTMSVLPLYHLLSMLGLHAQVHSRWVFCFSECVS